MLIDTLHFSKVGRFILFISLPALKKTPLPSPSFTTTVFLNLRINQIMEEFKKIHQIVNLLLIERERVLTKEEQLILSEWLKEDNGNNTLHEKLKNEANIPARMKVLSEFDKDKAYSQFVKHTKIGKIRSISRIILKYVAILIPFIFAIWFISQNSREIETETKLASAEIQPGTSKAILKLADGTIVNLEEEKKIIAEYNGTIISNKTKEIVYQSSSNNIKSQEIQYNTIEIPRGGEYQLTLSDGTKVWLNSETKIKYPVNFPLKNREVYLEGEAYFEVVENSKSPFIVTTSKMKVNVLGTSFNVREYSDEILSTTTLVTGKVVLKKLTDQKEYNLMPNEQAVISDQNNTVVKSVNVNQFIAWKDKRILFEENTVEQIFNDLSRWYNFNVIYANPEAKELRFSIDVKRYDEFYDILEILEMTKKVKFEINENVVTIM